MASIEFSASLNTAQLEAAIKQSNATVKEWAQGVEKAGGQADQAFDKVAKTVEKTAEQQKNAITEQKAFIKGLIDEIKNLERAAKAAHETAIDTTAGIAKQNAMNVSREAQQELASAHNQLIQEKETLNRLQNETISQNKEEETSQGKIIESLKKWGMGLLTITGAIKAFKAIIASSNALTEEFGFTVDGAKGALQQFFQVFSTGAGQTGNPIANMIKGFKGSKELAQNIDLYNDSMRANHVLEAQEIETLKQKEAIFRNASNTAKQRERALNDWIAIRKEAAARELRIEQDLNTSLLNEIKNRPNLKGITDQEIGGFVTMYAKNPELMKKAEELSKIYSGMAEWDTAEKIAKLRKEIDQLLPSGITFESLMSSIRLNSALSDKQINALADSYKRLATAQGGGAAVEAESARWLGSIVNKGEDAEKKLNDIKSQIDTLTTSLATANESERKGIAEKIILLEKELKLQESIVNAALMAATVRETPISKITGLKPLTLLPGGLKIPSTLSGAPVTTPESDYISGTVMLSKQGEANQKKTIAEMLAADEKRKKNQQELIKGASELVYLAGKQLGLGEEELKVLDDKLQVIGQFASGNIVGAAVTAAMSIISGFMSLIPDNAAKFAAQVEHLNRLLEVQQRLIDQSARTGGGAVTREGNTDILEAKKAEQEAALKKAQDYLNPNKFKWFRTKSGMKQAQQDVKDLTIAIQDTDYEILQAQQDLQDFFTGTTQGSVADAIMQGFQDGKTSAADFADTFYNFMRGAIDNALRDALSVDLTEWYAKFAADKASGGELTDEEMIALRKWYEEIIAKAKADRDAMYAVAGIDPTAGTTANPGLTGIVRNMSEDTGNELTSLFRRYADEQRVVKDYSILGVAHLVNIEMHTYNTVEELKIAVGVLNTIASNTAAQYGSIPGV